MRKILFVIFALIAFVPMAKADKYTLDRDALPVKAQEMLTTYFPKAKVSMIKVDRHLLKKTDYDVKLVNGTKIEFNNAGSWTSVDCKKRSVPDELVPQRIRKKVASTYPDATINKITKKSGGHIIVLSDGTELKFSVLGQLKKSSDSLDE
ncbi:PepSY-like domain-containing protein [uncultured Muribaculum sp.]|uniref:PepSY-like domain-containing protein n=1 Tax=uncultured Muribaculum sp. TaxID=1918613 RepID=UPI0025D07818|nr:PepSY-like domain-containing protein [uncultured Muribaculum sp.]